MRPWYERYFGPDYWVYAGYEYTAERTEAEVAYLVSVLSALAPGRRVLDVGSGLGRHSLALARHGFEVTGIDASAWAVEQASAAARAAGVAASFHQLDFFTASSWPVSRVDAVVCVQSFGWGSDADQLRMLRSFRSLLAPGGVLVLDHSNVSAILRMYSARSVVSVGDRTFEFLRRYDQLTGRSSGILRVCRADGTSVDLPDDVRLYQPPEVAALLASAGFEVLRADADFRVGAAVAMDTRYVQFVARAPGWPESVLAGHQAPVAGGDLDLRWAPDEVSFVDGALRAAWSSVSSGGSLADRSRRYDLRDPYGAERSAATLGAFFGFELPPSQVTAGAGATGLLRGLAGLAAGGTVLADPLGHTELPLAASTLGVPVRASPLAEVAGAVRAVRELRPAVTVVDRPDVAGRLWPLDDLSTLAGAVASAGGVLVVDETCASYLPPRESAVPLTADFGQLVVVRSMSKGYCCGGLRVGFAVCGAAVASRVRAVSTPLAAAALSLDVSLALLAQGDVLAPLRARVAELKPQLVSLLAAAGLTVHAGDPRLPWVTVDAGAAADGAAVGAVNGAAGTTAADRAAADADAPDAAARLAALRIAGKAVPVAPGGPRLIRISVPLSEPRWQAARAALGGRR